MGYNYIESAEQALHTNTESLIARAEEIYEYEQGSDGQRELSTILHELALRSAL